MKEIALTDPSRRMRNCTSARALVFRCSPKFFAIWRTMFSRYPGNGKVDALRAHGGDVGALVRPSARRPPSGRRLGRRGGAASGVGVAGGTASCAGALVGIGIALGGVCARGGRRCGLRRRRRRRRGGTTTPSARGPGGAATMFTRYMGGSCFARRGMHEDQRRHDGRVPERREGERECEPCATLGARYAHRAIASGSATSPTSPTPAARITASTCTTVPYGTPLSARR